MGYWKQVPSAIFLFLFLLLSPYIYGQEMINNDGKEDLIIGANAHYGWVIMHRPSMARVITGHTSAFELNIGKQTIGKQAWNEWYKYPIVGASYFFADLGNPQQMGYAHSVYAWINFPLARKQTYTFSFRLGAGLGYITKKFERVENYKNDVIGSHLNGVMHLNFENSWKLSAPLNFYTKVGITHFSNGAYKTPNLGINICTLSMGFTYRFGHDTIHFPPKKNRIPFADKKLFYYLTVAGGAKEIAPPDGDKYGVVSVSFAAMKQLGYKSSLGIGLDYFNDASLKPLFLSDTTFIGKNYHVARIGLVAAHELAISNVRIVMNLGYYLLSDWKANGMIYDRIGLKYYMNRHLFANVTLKTHFAKADFLEMGFGYKF